MDGWRETAGQATKDTQPVVVLNSAPNENNVGCSGDTPHLTPLQLLLQTSAAVGWRDIIEVWEIIEMDSPETRMG